MPSLIDNCSNSSCGNSSRSSTTAAGQNSGNSSSGNSNRTGDTDDDLQTIKDALAKQETKQVFRLRVFVVLILIAAASSITLAVFFLTKKAEAEEFEIQYEGVAGKILEHFEEILKEMSAVSGLAVGATIHNERLQEMHTKYGIHDETEYPVEWPFVTLPNFQERAGNVRSISGAIYVSINPIVSIEQLPFWEDYVQSEASSWM